MINSSSKSNLKFRRARKSQKLVKPKIVSQEALQRRADENRQFRDNMELERKIASAEQEERELRSWLRSILKPIEG